MYKAIGEAAFNDGLFSQSAPFQKYQASVSQFAEGSLGATSRLIASHQATRRLKPVGRRIVPLHRGAAGLGRTFLPAFSAREMAGLGYAYHDGSLGDTTITLPGVTTTPTPAPASPWKPDLASVGIGVMAGALLLHFVKF